MILFKNVLQHMPKFHISVESQRFKKPVESSLGVLTLKRQPVILTEPLFLGSRLCNADKREVMLVG